jgi:hypothetical protein
VTEKAKRSRIIDELAAVPARVRQAAGEAEGKLRPPGEWSLNAVVGHLGRVEAVVWQARFQQLAAEDDPHWERWEPDGIDWEGEYGGRPLERLLADFEAARLRTVRYLEELAEGGWARQGTHRSLGRLDVAGLCLEMNKHDEVHIGQIRMTI